MNDAALFDATVPVFRHYLQRVNALLLKLSKGQESLLQQSLFPNTFSAAEHLDAALGFVTRTLFPLLGQEVPILENRVLDRNGLIESGSSVLALLQGTDPHEFEGAASRLVRHRAGEAELEQDATAFLTIFALPNFFYHLVMAFAILRREGVAFGKEDFDGQHFYPAKFNFWI